MSLTDHIVRIVFRFLPSICLPARSVKRAGSFSLHDRPQESILYTILLFQVLALTSCFNLGLNNYEDIIQKPSTDWSTQESLTILLSCMEHNVFDGNSPYVKVFAIPYYPAVILASNRVWEDRHHLSSEEFRTTSENLARLNAGLYIDWTRNQFVDGRGNYFRGPLQLDSLMFLIHIENISGSNNFSSLLKEVRIMDVSSGSLKVSIESLGPQKTLLPFLNSAYPSYTPDISDLEQRIYLVNDKEKFIRPKYVWGKRQSLLMGDENLLVMFPFRNEGHHFLDGSEKMYLVIKGFETDIKLTFNLSKIH